MRSTGCWGWNWARTTTSASRSVRARWWRVSATVLRRTRRPPGAAARPASGGLVLDEASWRASLDGLPLELTAVEFKLLSVLANQPGRIYSREQLMDAMYRDERIVADRTVDSHVKKLRRKLAEAVPDDEFIHSVYGVGYCYEDRR